MGLARAAFPLRALFACAAALTTAGAAPSGPPRNLPVTPSALPRPADGPARGGWFAQPGTKLRAALSKAPGLGDPGLMMEAWSGGALDPRSGTLFVLGGGLGNYKGNELYAFSAADMRWTRLTEPCTDFACADPNPCGQPIVRHTYNGVAFIAHADKLFLHGGAFNCEGKACSMHETWTFDVKTRKWQRMLPGGAPPDGNSCGANSAYDAATGLVYYADESGFRSYDVGANLWKKLDGHGSYYQTAVVDPKRHLYVLVGAGAMAAYDLGAPGKGPAAWVTTGDQAIVKASNPGIDYDPESDRLVAWSGGAVYAIDPDKKAWEKLADAGAPAPTANGMFGRWRYVPARKAFIAVTGVDADVHFFAAPRALEGTGADAHMGK